VLAVLNEDGRVLAFPVDDVKALDKGKGVLLMGGGGRLARVQFVADPAAKNEGWPLLSEHLGKRGAKGHVPAPAKKSKKAPRPA